jgi:hypothetical protein
MKLSQLNSSEQPPAMSVSNSRNNPCLGHDSNAAAVAFLTDDGISYLLPYAQFLYAERMANPALENDPEAPSDKMSIHFVGAGVVVLGSGLKRLEAWLQKNELSSVKSGDSRLDGVSSALITAVTVSLTKENV